MFSGAIFDKNSEEIREAFKSQINFLNNNEDKSDIRLIAEVRELDATDSFAVSNASKLELMEVTVFFCSHFNH